MANFCSNCGSPLNSTAVFCGGCGTRVPTDTPIPNTFTPTAVTAPAADFTAVPEASTPQVEAAPDLAGFSSVPETWLPPPIPPVAPSTPPPATAFSAAPVTAPAAGFTSVPGAFTPPVEPTPDSAGFSSVPSAWLPPPTPPPATPTPIDPGYASVIGDTGPTSVPYTQTPTAYAPTQTAYIPAPAATAMPPMAYPAAKKSNALLKVLIAIVILIFIGGALVVGGLWYAAKKIKAKAQTAYSQVLGDTAASSSNGVGSSASVRGNGEGGIKGDPCRFLSKAEVSQAVGLPIIRTEVQDNGCSYIAKGDPADVTAKHLSSMLGSMGADAQTQKMAQKFAGGLFAQQEATDKDLSAEAAKGEIPVLAVLFTSGHAVTEMKMNRRAFEHIKGGGPASDATSTDLTGIGDEAYVAGGSILMLRKGNVMARMTYVSCPCNTENIKPLAKTLAARL
jgi:hypothetical protein